MSNNFSSFRQLAVRFALPHWKWYAIGIIALAVTNYIMLEIPDRSKHVINGLMESRDLSELETIVISIILLGSLQMLIRALSRILIFWPGRKIESDIKDHYFQRFMRLPTEFLDRFGMGDLISRLANDVNHIRICFAFAALQMINLSFLTIFTINKMITVHWQLTLLSILPISLMVIVTKLGMPKLHKYSLQAQETLSELTNDITESFVNVHVIQANSAKDSFLKRISTSNQSVYEANLKLTIIRTIIFPVMVLFTGFSYVIVLYYGGLEVSRGNLTVGDIMAFNVYIGFLMFPLTAVGIVIAVLQRAKAAASRLSELENNELEKGEQEVLVSPKKSDTPLLEVRNLNYRYPKQDDDEEENSYVISDLSFSLQQGHRLGIVGKVGSGKSTLFKLITKIIEPPKNTIFWNGIDITEIKPEPLRKQIGFATQSVHLFSDTIAKNLCFGTDYHDDSPEIIEAAKKAQIIEDIEKLDRSWQTEIGEKGVRLSGGQKQRLSLARVFLRNPQVYLLDDVTSALDHHTEQKVINHIHNTNQSLIISSHRASALQGCQNILILEDGKVKDQGNLNKLKTQYPEAFLAE